MITGRLIEYNDMYYAILNLKHKDGKRLQKRFSLDLSVKNNKRRAEEKLSELCRQHTNLCAMEQNASGILFGDFLIQWLEEKRTKISPTTYRSYESYRLKYIQSILGNHQLNAITFRDIEGYYQVLEKQGLSSTTILHHHAMLHQAFSRACKYEMIPTNPMQRVERPKRAHFEAGYYSAEEAQALLLAVKETAIEVPVALTLFYGLRRSEVLGLRWSDVNFEANTLSVNRAVVGTMVDDRYTTVVKNTLKGVSAYRTMPLCEEITNLLQAEQRKKAAFQSEYVCTDKYGRLMKPDYLSQTFSKLLEQNNLRHIRYHDLRHSCAGLLIASRTPLIEVQHWLGHATMLTTADLYAHLDDSLKDRCADSMKKI